MSFQIDAWLERNEPSLTVTDPLSGLVLIRWGAEQVRSLLEQGEIAVNDLLAPDGREQEVVRELFLIACRQLA